MQQMQMREINRRTRAATNGGFSLIELVVVILLLGIMTAFAVPKFKGMYQQSEMARVATKLIELINYAHQRAVLEQQPQTLIADIREGEYWMEVLDEERESKRRGSRTRSSRRRQKTLKTLDGKLPKDYEFTYCYLPLKDDVVRRDEARLVFYPDGSCDGMHLILARLDPDNDRNDRYIFIRLNSNTGKISVLESYSDRDADDFFEGYWDEEEKS